MSIFKSSKQLTPQPTASAIPALTTKERVSLGITMEQFRSLHNLIRLSSECILSTVGERPIDFKWINKDLNQSKYCNLPWEISLNRSGHFPTHPPCTTEEQYRAKTMEMDAYFYAFLDPNTPAYAKCPGLSLNQAFFDCAKKTQG